MTGISVRFETRELEGREVLVLRYRLKRFVVVRFLLKRTTLVLVRFVRQWIIWRALFIA